MLKKIFLTGCVVGFSGLAVVAQEKVKEAKPTDTVGDYINSFPTKPEERAMSLESAGLYIVKRGNQECVHYFNKNSLHHIEDGAGAKPDDNASAGHICKERKTGKKLPDPPHGRVHTFHSPAFCPTNNTDCITTQGSMSYVYCPHSGSQPPEGHMDIYYGAAGGYRMGRVDVDFDSFPPNCSTSSASKTKKQTGRPANPEQSVTCTGTCNFNYYPKP